jgi:hypothetical protein
MAAMMPTTTARMSFRLFISTSGQVFIMKVREKAANLREIMAAC